MADEKKYTPSLRFPEFLNDGEWKEHTFSDVFTFVPNNTLSRANLNNENGSVQNIHYGDILIKFGEYLNVQTEHLPFISNVQDIERYRKAKLANGDVIIADTAEDETVGKCTELVGIADEFIVSGLHTIAVRPNNTFATGYLGFYMNSNSYREQLKRVMQGVKVLSVSKTAISQTRLRFPSSRIEQGRIADCLTFLDSYIYDTKSKLQQLKAHKRGLMQRLFPTKGKTVPKLRFPEFRNSEEWKDYAIRDIFERIAERNRIGCRNVLTISAQYGIVSQSEYFNKNVAAADLSNYYLIKRGDFAYNKSRSQGYTYGIIRPLNLYKDGIVSPIYLCFRIKQGITCCRDFLEYLFDTVPLLDNLGEIAQEGARNHGLLNIATEDFFDKMRLTIPVTIDEQQKIADCLSSINDEIKSYEDKITALELHKKGLMQQLFPKL